MKVREWSLFTAGGAGGKGGDAKLWCKQLEGGQKSGAQLQRGGGQNFSAQTSECHLQASKNHR